jgi:hypothetical protein
VLAKNKSPGLSKGIIKVCSIQAQGIKNNGVKAL